MYARRVSVNLKANSQAEFTRQLEKEIIPMLRKQKGFQDEITFVSPSGKTAFAISLWDDKECAETYSRAAYPQVTQLLSKVVDGTPQVETYEVSNSTYHKVGAAVAA